ncbi:hypothetical protein AMC77_01575 [Candidatus Profftella armatura]|nr:hypothetical protein AMC77_01575 [Candidatus Profftella armatura]
MIYNTQNKSILTNFIKKIKRHKKSSYNLSFKNAELLYNIILKGKLSDIELGAFLLAMRIKGESVEEISGFLNAINSLFIPLEIPISKYAPIIIPSYNGSRRFMNVIPLLALLLSKKGIPVFIHGIKKNFGRITTYEILKKLGYFAVSSKKKAIKYLKLKRLVFMDISILIPELSKLLEIYYMLGIRNSSHLLVKIIQPLSIPALRLVSYTHPEYLKILSDYFYNEKSLGDIFLMQGTEGEVIPNIRNSKQIIHWFHDNKYTKLTKEQNKEISFPKNSNINDNVLWIQSVLDNKLPIPSTIINQVKNCILISRMLSLKYSNTI